MAIALLQVLRQIVLHASQLANALLKSSDILALQCIEVLTVGREAGRDDLLDRLFKGVCVMPGHSLHQIEHFFDLPILTLL